jgi:hypothetical protein
MLETPHLQLIPLTPNQRARFTWISTDLKVMQFKCRI